VRCLDCKSGKENVGVIIATNQQPNHTRFQHWVKRKKFGELMELPNICHLRGKRQTCEILFWKQPFPVMMTTRPYHARRNLYRHDQLEYTQEPSGVVKVGAKKRCDDQKSRMLCHKNLI
jgi:hypothetical protein